MNSSFRPIWFILFVVAGLAAVVGISRMQNSQSDGNERVPWKHDLAAARKQSAIERKPILIYFTASWCGPCQQMKRTTWADERVAAALTKYIPVKIDIDEQSEVAREFGVRSIPRVERIEPSGEHHLLVEGAISPEEMLSIVGSP